MQEKIHTIPVNEAFESGDECPFCHMERQVERRTLRFVAGPGASYMEPDVRYQTDKHGFCPTHMQKLYDYGNLLGAALMLQNHYGNLVAELHEAMENREGTPKRRLFGKKQEKTGQPYHEKLSEQVQDCYVCQRMNDSMNRYYETFFYLTREPEFREKAENSKGICLRHLAALLEREDKLPSAQREWFYTVMMPKVERDLARVKEDLDWFIAKHDYRNAGADWKNSRDALPRTMQKLAGIHPTDKPYKGD
jgi:hypothetical protein